MYRFKATHSYLLVVLVAGYACSNGESADTADRPDLDGMMPRGGVTSMVPARAGADDTGPQLIQTDEEQASTGGTPEPQPINHPFMYLTQDRHSFIIENIKTEPMASIYLDLQAVADRELKSIELNTWDAKDHGDNGEIAAANAFLAWLNDDAIAAGKAIAAMETLQSNWADHSGWGINIRMQSPLIHYTAAWDLLSATPYFSLEQAQSLADKLTTITQQFFDKYVLEAGIRELALTVAQNNHPIRTASAIGFVALAFPGHPQASEWLDWAVSELDYLLGPMGQYVLEDGAVSEGPFYFNFGLAPTIPFFIALSNQTGPQRSHRRNCINRSDVDPWTGHGCVDGEVFTFENPMGGQHLLNVFDWSLALRLPNGNRAPIADSPLRNQSGQALFTHFGGADYLYWDWASNPSSAYSVKGGFELAISHLAYVKPLVDATPPSWTNRFFIDGGLAVFRSGWTQDDRMLVLLGENGAARKTLHDHVDGTSFIMAAYGDLLLTDTGYYKPSSLADAVTSVAGSHNLILIDGKGAPDKGGLNTWGDADAFIENTMDDGQLAYAEARQMYQATQVVRGVLAVRGQYFIVADRLKSDEMRERTYRFRLHAYAGRDLDGRVTLEQFGPRIERERGAVSVYTRSTQGDCVLQEPPFEANASPHVHKLNKDAAHHTVTDSVIVGQNPDFLTILAPYRSGEDSGEDAALTVTPIPTAKGVAWSIQGDGFHDVAWLREDGAAQQLELNGGEVIETDGAFVFLALDGSTGFLRGGRFLNVDGSEVVAATDEQAFAVKRSP